VCREGVLARFIDRHVTRFRPIASTHFKMRYNNMFYISRRQFGHAECENDGDLRPVVHVSGD